MVSKQLEFVKSNSFKFCVISNGKVEMLNFEQCELDKNWDFRHEQNIQESKIDLPKDFSDLILKGNTENIIR